jgi:DNA-directed RNA polymerase subunit omega
VADVGNEFVSKYHLVKVAARRARQLQQGAEPTVKSRSMKACKVAQDEIEAGQVKFVLPELPDKPNDMPDPDPAA